MPPAWALAALGLLTTASGLLIGWQTVTWRTLVDRHNRAYDQPPSTPPPEEDSR